jgi:hypothetical protein
MGEKGFKFVYFHLSVLYGDIHWYYSWVLSGTFGKISCSVSEVVVVVDEVHNFFMKYILINDDNRTSFICFWNYGVVTNEFFFNVI